MAKHIERDWFKYEDIELMGYFKKWQLPPMIGNLYHLLQLLIILSATTMIYYCMVLNGFVEENKDKLDEEDPNWEFERSASILNLILSFIILVISIIGVWSISLSPEKIKEMHRKKIKMSEEKINRAPTMLRKQVTIYRDLYEDL